LFFGNGDRCKRSWKSLVPQQPVLCLTEPETKIYTDPHEVRKLVKFWLTLSAIAIDFEGFKVHGIRLIQVYDGVNKRTYMIASPLDVDTNGYVWFEQSGIKALFYSNRVIKFHFGASDLKRLTENDMPYHRCFVDLQHVASAVIRDEIGANMRHIATFGGTALGVACGVGKPGFFPDYKKLFHHFGHLVPKDGFWDRLLEADLEDKEPALYNAYFCYLAYDAKATYLSAVCLARLRPSVESLQRMHVLKFLDFKPPDE
jgi:hypothetical protein